MVSNNKRIKLFNKILKNFLEQYNVVSSEQFSMKIKEFSILETYNSDIEKVKEQFINCNQECFKTISLCNKINLDNITPEIYNNNKKIIWKYLHDLYFITLEKVTDDVLLDSKRSINNLITELIVAKSKTNEIPGIPGIPDISALFGQVGMNDLINDITQQVTEKLQGQDLSDLNPNELMSQLISGNNSIKGVDLSSIIQNSLTSIQTKVSNGEIDLEQLKSVANNFVPEHFKDLD